MHYQLLTVIRFPHCWNKKKCCYFEILRLYDLNKYVCNTKVVAFSNMDISDLWAVFDPKVPGEGIECTV